MKKYLLVFIISIEFTASRAQVINSVAGNGTSGYTGDGGSATSAELNNPITAISDTSGNIYISDCYNFSIRKVDLNGNISAFAGTGVQGYSGDGGAATSAQLNFLGGLAIDDSGNVYVADASNSVVRKINRSGIITTIAGNGTSGYSGDGGPAISAQLGVPSGIALDHDGCVFIVDMQFGCLRKVDGAGIISTIIPVSQLLSPTSVVLDSKSNLFICNTAAQQIIKSDTIGNYIVYAGTGAIGFAGDGGPATSAKFNFPNYSGPGPIISIGLDKNDRLYIPDCFNNRVRRIDTSGIIHTIAGTGVSGFSGDGGIPTSAKLSAPAGVSVDAIGNIFIADWGNQRIREIRVPNGVSEIIKRDITIYPNPSGGIFTVESNQSGIIEITGEEGLLLERHIITPYSNEIHLKLLEAGIYNYQFISKSGLITVGKLSLIF
jgi:sugar lactone lactonase YvrE